MDPQDSQTAETADQTPAPETAAEAPEIVEAEFDNVTEITTGIPVHVDTILGDQAVPETAEEAADSELRAVLEAIVYVTDEPLTLDQIAGALQLSVDRVKPVLDELAAAYEKPGRGISIREVAGGYKMCTKPEHHDAVRRFVRNLQAPLKLSLPALETLAVIAYKQPVTAPEIMEIRGVQGGGVLKTLLDRKLITTAGRKNVVGKPILYKTTKEFLVQFGLAGLSELPSLKEFEEIRRMSMPEEAETAAPVLVKSDDAQGDLLAEVEAEPAVREEATEAPEPQIAAGEAIAPAPEPEAEATEPEAPAPESEPPASESEAPPGGEERSE